MTCNVDTASLEVANSQIADFNNVTAGMSVCVPLACCQSLECTGGSDLAPAPSDSVVAEGMLMNSAHGQKPLRQILCLCVHACSSNTLHL